MDNTWSAIFHIAKTTTGPPVPDECSDEGKDFLNLCFQIDPVERPAASEVSYMLHLEICVLSNEFFCFDVQIVSLGNVHCQLLSHPFVQVPDTPRESRQSGF